VLQGSNFPVVVDWPIPSAGNSVHIVKEAGNTAASFNAYYNNIVQEKIIIADDAPTNLFFPTTLVIGANAAIPNTSITNVNGYSQEISIVDFAKDSTQRAADIANAGQLLAGGNWRLRPVTTIYPEQILTLDPTVQFSNDGQYNWDIFGKTNPMSLTTDFQKL
jgi:hypothetical protein